MNNMKNLYRMQMLENEQEPEATRSPYVNDLIKLVEEIKAGTKTEEDLSEAAGKGISMIKVASEQALIWSNEIRNFVTGHPDVMFPEDIQKPALAAVKESMRNYIRLFHANGQIK